MILLIAGSRSINITVSDLARYVKECGVNIDSIITGGAKGVDNIGEEYAKKYNIPLRVFKTNWKLGRGAGLINNKVLSDEADALLAIYDGKSKGTKHIIDLMSEKGKKVYVFYA